MTAEPSRTPMVDFGPDQQFTLFANIRPTQAALAATGLVVLWATFQFNPTAAALVAAAAYAVATVALAAAGADRTAVPAIRYAANVALRRHRSSRAATPWVFDGRGALETPGQTPPPHLTGVRLFEYSGYGFNHGFVHDPARNGYLALIKIEGHPTNKLDPEELDSSLDAWERVQQGLGDESSGVARFGWIAISAPSTGGDLIDDLNLRGVNLDGDAAQSYRDLVTSAGPTAEVHDTYLAVQVATRAKTPHAEDKMMFGHHAHRARTALAPAMQRAADELAGAGWKVLDRWLSPADLAAVFRLIHRPDDRGELGDRRAAGDSGAEAHTAWPSDRHDRRRMFVCDGVAHVTFAMERFPERPIAANFLTALALHASGPRVMSMWFEAWDPEKALSHAERFATMKQAARDKAREKGFAEPSRAAEQARLDAEYVAEIVQGATPFKVYGWVSVSAPDDDPDLLDARVAALYQAGRASQVRLFRRNGQHERTMANLLPTGRGCGQGFGQ